MVENLEEKAARAAKWSILTELLVKLIAPATQLILARILTPAAFGMVATVTMVTSFAEMLSDSGFQKYLVQHEFRNRQDLEQNANVAFWTNLSIAVMLWGLIALFRNPLASLVGNPGLGSALAVASLSLPLASFSSIQLALYRRDLRFKKLLPARVAVAFVPLLVTLPLAVLGLGFWSLIIGTLMGALVNALVLTVMSPWRPRFFYSGVLLKQMFSFSGWSLLEAISIWLTTWAGTFIVGSLLAPYYLGLYRQSMSIVNQLFALVTSSTVPILFASLSRLQNNNIEFNNFFYKFQFSIGMIVLPLGVGIFMFRDVVTDIVLGAQWAEASLMLGAWGLSSGIMIVFSFYCSEVFRALGRPKISMLAQCLYMAVMIPVLFFSARAGFGCLAIAGAAVRVVAIAINQVLCFLVSGISLFGMIKRLKTPLIATLGMALFAVVARTIVPGDVVVGLALIVSCIAVYMLIIMIFVDGRSFLRNLYSQIFHIKS